MADCRNYQMERIILFDEYLINFLKILRVLQNNGSHITIFGSLGCGKRTIVQHAISLLGKIFLKLKRFEK